MAILNKYKDPGQAVPILSQTKVDWLESICPIAEKILSVMRPEMKGFKLSDTLAKTNVYWVKEGFLLKESKKRIKSDFADKMHKDYLERRKKALRDDNSDLLEALDEMYEPWVKSRQEQLDDIKKGGTTIYDNLLGWYNPKKKEIFICLEKIFRYPNKFSILADVLLHELGHAIMHNDNHLHYKELCDYWMEESLANKLMLEYLNAYKWIMPISIIDFNAIVDFVKNQHNAYKYGYILFKHNLFDCQTLKKYKDRINPEIGNLLVEILCQAKHYFEDYYLLLQTTFFDTFVGCLSKSSINLPKTSSTTAIGLPSSNNRPYTLKQNTKKKELEKFKGKTPCGYIFELEIGKAKIWKELYIKICEHFAENYDLSINRPMLILQGGKNIFEDEKGFPEADYYEICDKYGNKFYVRTKLQAPEVLSRLQKLMKAFGINEITLILQQ